MKIQVFPLEYEGKKRIGIKPLGFDRAFPGMMKQIKGSRWTPNERCWHIPYTPEAYDQLKRLFGEGQVLPVGERPLEGKERRSDQAGRHCLKSISRCTNRNTGYSKVRTEDHTALVVYNRFFGVR